MPENLERRVQQLEDNQRDLGASLSVINTTLALLNQTVETMAKNEQKKKEMMDKGLLFVVGGFITAFIAWIVRGGLGQ